MGTKASFRWPRNSSKFWDRTDMTPEVLKPDLELLRQEYVLVQAWKKTANYIRYHNWFSDTLELDWTTVNLPEFIKEIEDLLESPDQWKSVPLRLVPAPKSQRWQVLEKSGEWMPKEKGAAGAPLRPLAHVRLRDQVVATALMLCLANRVETEQGDPRNSILNPESREDVSSYGNRLFCDMVNGELRHRWGSTKLYRSYFQDYRSFISRPSKVAETVKKNNGQRVFIVESDLSQFYDRVRPEQLAGAFRSFQRVDDDPIFFDFAEKVLDWGWDSRDSADAAAYATESGLEDFSQVALPQGLVPAGFFANVVLISFDERLRSCFGEEVVPGIRLEDACRYVDDLRLVVTTDLTADQCQIAIAQWLQCLLQDESPGLRISKCKTKAAEFEGSDRPFVRQGTKMERIQSGVSGGFDAIAGAEILDAVQGLMRTQEALSRGSVEGGWQFSPIPDVRDQTVARFSAGRFRSTYRSIRPLLEAGLPVNGTEESETESDQSPRVNKPPSQEDLDEDARAFSLSLIERWVEDPSNVRLLRIGLDIWPDAQVLQAVLGLLRPFTEPRRLRKGPRRVAWYCLSEILRAGATETGLVNDEESLPAKVDLQRYRETLRDEAKRLIRLPAANIPWYLRQQALLFLATFDPASTPVIHPGRSKELRKYRRLILFLRGENTRLDSHDFGTLAVLTRRGFSDADATTKLVKESLTLPRKREIAVRDPSFALELSKNVNGFFDDLPAQIREDLCIKTDVAIDNLQNLSEIVLTGGAAGPLRNELTLLRFTAVLLDRLEESSNFEVLTPSQVLLKLDMNTKVANVEEVKLLTSRISDSSLYRPPDWCMPNDRWRFQLGFLLRFILSRQPDFTSFVRPEYWKERIEVYRPVRSHWYQRIFGLFNGQQAFGDDWLPISDWLERFLLALLHWPGCRIPKDFDWVGSGIAETREKIEGRIQDLEGKLGSATGSLLLPMITERPTAEEMDRPLRACVVQTVVPDEICEGDLTFSEPDIRLRHRNHLSAALEAVKQMLNLRATHEKQKRRLDWLILPELAVHPRDVETHLVPLARAYKTIILAGLTYEELLADEPAINSALWVLPEWTKDHGLQIRTRRQGKQYLSPDEKEFNLKGFRPCQWLIGYPWSRDFRPVWLTASVCYDATDLGLATDLREQSDVFAIPAFNKDIKTFDKMALALHYHMFQLVLVANNGTYGGSNAYWPRKAAYKRQIFHMHGQLQASIAFLDINSTEMVEFLLRRNQLNQAVQPSSPQRWKHPPAGLGEPNDDTL